MAPSNSAWTSRPPGWSSRSGRIRSSAICTWPRAWTRRTGSASARRWCPLTNATIAYTVAGSVVARDVGTVIVNRVLVDWIVPTADEAVSFPEVEVRAPVAIGAAGGATA